MILESLAAAALLFFTFPLWFFVSFAWGFIKAIVTFGVLLFAFLNSSTKQTEEVLGVILAPILQGFASAFSVPSYIWHWAKFEHPWWAVVLALIAACLFGNSRR